MTNLFKQLLYCTSCIILPSTCLAKVTPLLEYEADLSSKPDGAISCTDAFGSGWSSTKIDNATCQKQSLTDGSLCYKCSCATTFKLTTCPTKGSCTSCNGKYRLDSCAAGYIVNSDKTACVANCDGYPITGNCPEGGTCTSCANDATKKKLDSCDTAKGWTKSGNTCVAKSCPAGYATTVTTCSSSSTKPSLKTSGYSGGKVCGMCVCSNVDTSCTASSYPLSSQPANAYSVSCDTGCGSEKVTRYKITSCHADYKLSGNTCILKECVDYDATYKTSRPANHTCSVVTPRTGLSCYANCTKKPCDDGYALVNGKCEQIYESCAEAGYIEVSDRWVGDCGKYIDGCSDGGAKMRKVYSGTDYMECYLPECAVPDENLCKTPTKPTPQHTCDYYKYLDESIQEPNYQCWSVTPEEGLVCYNCIHWCSVNDRDPSDTRCWNMNDNPLMSKLPVFAENIRDMSKVLTLANIDGKECYNKYIKALEDVVDDDDFVTYI